MNTLDKVIQNVFGSLSVSPSFPYLARRSPLMPIVLGALGVAVIGGLAAVIILSPRTRTRAIEAAKGTAAKIGARAMGGARLAGVGRKEDRVTQPNGLAAEHAASGYGSPSGV
jgi:hypothetical protein